MFIEIVTDVRIQKPLKPLRTFIQAARDTMVTRWWQDGGTMVARWWHDDCQGVTSEKALFFLGFYDVYPPKVVFSSEKGFKNFLVREEKKLTFRKGKLPLF